MIKKTFLGVGSIVVITVIGIVIATNTGVKADTEVTMKQYNELVSRIDNLETKLEEADNKITILEEKVVNQENTIKEYETKINNTNSNLSNVIKKTDNFEKWQDKFFELVESTSGFRYDTISWGGLFRSLEEYQQTIK